MLVACIAAPRACGVECAAHAETHAHFRARKKVCAAVPDAIQ